jgi:hypothetical protein
MAHCAKPIEILPQWTVWQLQEHLEKDNEMIVLDVRQPAEWKAGHIENALHITGAELPSRIEERTQRSACGINLWQRLPFFGFGELAHEAWQSTHQQRAGRDECVESRRPAAFPIESQDAVSNEIASHLPASLFR